MSARNPFIDVKPKRLHFLNDGTGTSIKKLHQQAKFYKNEFDLETSLEIEYFLKWKEPHKDNYYISPLIFKPVKIKLKRKIEHEYIIEKDEDAPYLINPILDHSLSRFYDVELPDELENIEEFLTHFQEQLNSKSHQLQLVDSIDEKEEWQLIRTACLGNFNYKKSLLGKDYERIISDPSEQILDLLNGTSLSSQNDADIITPIIDLDFSQKETVIKSSNNNLVVQGPPGTGKSHTIVGMIGNYLAQGKNVLFVSQKRSALEVVYERLQEFGLDKLVGFLNTEKDEKKEFFGELKDSWEFMSAKSTEEISEIQTSDDLTNFYLNTFQEKNEALGASFHEVIIDLFQSGFKPSDLQYTGQLPALSEWRQNVDFLEELESKLTDKFKIEKLSDAAFTKLNKAVFKETDPLIILDKRLNELSATLSVIEKVKTENELDNSYRKIFDCALAASILDMVNQTQLDLLNKDSKSFNSFSNWAKKYELLRSKVERAEQASKNWKHKPTKSEITELIDLLKHHHAPKGILGILKRRNERLEKAFQDFSPDLSDIAKQQLLEELRVEWNLKAELDEIKIKLKHNFNIADPDKEIQHILQIRTKLDNVSADAYLKILEHEKSNDLIKKLSGVHTEIQSFNGIARFIFHDDLPDELADIKSLVDKIKNELHHFKVLMPELQRYFMLSYDIRDLIQKNAFSVSHLSAIIAYHNLIEQTRFELAFDDLSGENILQELDQLARNLDRQYEANRKKILYNYKKLIANKEELLTTPASKLKQEQKDLKKQYRQIKKLLVHEMSKKQRHIPIKDFTKETWDYLSDIHPVWIMNPLSVSERLNCEKQMFDVVIFDESSQIPLEDALPAIYRSKQVIVVGDEKQMPPSSFFSFQSDGPTLLDKADVSYPKIMLKWHYRSNHPQLIQFSNQQFYDNELLTVPPVQNEIPIEFKKINGIFENGVNEIEANSIAEFLSDGKYKPEDIGIIAFSKDQENQIRMALQSKKILHEDLLIRNLENVQGIERDHIIISVGYAPNKEGNFSLNFGPVNQQSGSNRLNVLFTRAKKKITLFTSVTANEFKLSDNPGVNCLKDYLFFAENLTAEVETEDDPYSIARNGVIHFSHVNGSAIYCFVQQKSGKVLMIDPCTKEKEASDLYTVYSVLKSRFSEVRILLTKDIWSNQTGYKDLIKDYFEA